MKSRKMPMIALTVCKQRPYTNAVVRLQKKTSVTVKSKKRAPRILAIYKKSLFQIYVRERKNARIRKLLEEGGPIAARLHRSHQDHIGSIEEAKKAFSQLGAKAVFRYRSDVNNVGEFDLVVTLGGDGTLLWASHIVGSDVPVVAINTSPLDSVGHFCAGAKGNLVDVLDDAISGRLKETRLTRMRVDMDGEIVSNRVLNDALFCHKCPAATTRYIIRFDWSAAFRRRPNSSENLETAAVRGPRALLRRQLRGEVAARIYRPGTNALY
jgi:NAD kinase